MPLIISTARLAERPTGKIDIINLADFAPDQRKRTDLVDNVNEVGRPEGNGSATTINGAGGNHLRMIGGSVRNPNRTGGTEDRSYTLDRLAREAPELRQRVDAGELSANAAAIKAEH